MGGKGCWQRMKKQNNAQTGHNGGIGRQARLAGHPAGHSNMPGEWVVRGI